jgi:hypothetical protein
MVAHPLRWETEQAYDGVNAVQELSGGNPSANLLTGRLDEVFARTDTSTRNFLSDALGSTVALADSSGAVATQYSYEPFGLFFPNLGSWQGETQELNFRRVAAGGAPFETLP